MAQIQWLGSLEPRRTQMGYLAEALGKTGAGYFTGLEQKRKEQLEMEEKEKERAITREEIDLKRQQLRRDYSKTSYETRTKIYDTLIKAAQTIPEDRQRELFSSDEWRELEKSIGAPSLHDTTFPPKEEEKVPSWKQSQDVDSVRADLVRGRGSISDFFGKPEPTPITTMDEALDYISNKGLSPSLFKEELKKYSTTEGGEMGVGSKGKVVESRRTKDGRMLDKYSDGSIYYRDSGEKVR